MGPRASKDKPPSDKDPLVVPCGGKNAPCGGGNASEAEPKRVAAPKTLVQPALSIPRANPGWRLPERYQVLKSIGKGSYGSVCECRDADDGRLYAAKQLKGLFDDLVDCKRILRELAILTRLDSDSVVRVHDVVIPGSPTSFNELYIVLEICDSDMKKLTKSDVRLGGEHINTLLYNLLVGLKHIHSAGVYHRDLKPANILVNQNCDVKICDFGLARAIGGEGITDDHLEDEDGVGEYSTPVVAATMRRKRAMTHHVVTRWYRAPELILMQRGYTEAIDIWSVGCIYAELLQMQDEHVRLQDRQPLFPGSSCFPLSPERKGGKRVNKRGSNDQLESIFEVIGTPSKAEIEALDNLDARKYVQGFPTREAEDLRPRYRCAGPQELDLLTKMLIFSAKARLTVQQALEHQALASIRDNASRETVAAAVVILNFERESDERTGELTEAQLRRLFKEEMDKFREGT